MVTKRQRTKKQAQPFDVEAFVRERNAELRAKYTDDELDAIHAHAAAQVTEAELKEADEIARRFFEETKDGRNLPRSPQARRRGAT
jgi:hypothetical protein